MNLWDNIMRILSRMAPIVCLLAVAWSQSFAAPSSPKVRGDVVSQFNSLRQTSELIGFHIGNAPDTGFIDLGSLDQRTCHWQGVARHPDPETRVFYMARSTPDDATGDDAYHTGNIVAVLIDSADVSVDHRIRSNLLRRDKDLVDTEPWSTDKVIWNYPIPYQHPGSMQIAGNYLVVNVKDRISGIANNGEPASGIVIFNISNARSPYLVGYQSHTSAAGSMGIIRLDDGRYLMVNGMDDNVSRLRFTLSTGASIDSLARTNSYITTWDSVDHPTVPWPVIESPNPFGYFDPPPEVPLTLDVLQQDPNQAYYSFQALNLVQGENGSLFMIGTMNLNGWSPLRFPSMVEGPIDCAALYRVELDLTPEGVLQGVALSFVSVKYFTDPDTLASYPLGALILGYREEAISFNAGGGAYVSPDGDLFLYGTSHFNRHQNALGFRPIEPTYIGEISRAVPPTPAVELGTDVYVALYDRLFYGGKGIVLDGVDSNLENWRNLAEIENFGDDPRSLIYQIPVGATLFLFEDKEGGGRRITLSGTGSPVLIPNIGNLTWSNGETDTAGKISSLLVTPLIPGTLFISNERTSEDPVFNTFPAAYDLVPPHPDSQLKIHGPRTISDVVGKVLTTPMELRAFGGPVTLGP